MMTTYKIALYPGDGIGPDVTAEAARVMNSAAKRFGFDISFTKYNWGHAYWRETGKVVPNDFLDQLRNFDTILLGAVGDPAHLPDHITLAPLIQMRQAFDQYACVRPASLLPGIISPLANAEVDLVVVRENSEGEYVNIGGALRQGQPGELATQTAVHTRLGVTRILRYGFELARRRRGKLTMATKSNAWAYAMVLWDNVLDELMEQYPDVEANKVHIDALTMQFVRCPERLDVVVGSNLFGDILSDLAGAITGSIGLAPSANINPERAFPSLFEPVHGSAPDIAGKGIANPIGAIRSAAMMFDFLGETAAAASIEQAVVEALKDGKCRTPDLVGVATTTDVGKEIAGRVSAQHGGYSNV
jgi:tartrate dehydrogenase/decarboxylase / D-malate dehydrogenase